VGVYLNGQLIDQRTVNVEAGQAIDAVLDCYGRIRDVVVKVVRRARVVQETSDLGTSIGVEWNF
jgi:hypothetical protein